MRAHGHCTCVLAGSSSPILPPEEGQDIVKKVDFANKHNSNTAAGPRPVKKIGFAFIVNPSNLVHAALWERFFKGRMDRCNIYMHSTVIEGVDQDIVRRYLALS